MNPQKMTDLNMIHIPPFRPLTAITGAMAAMSVYPSTGKSIHSNTIR